VVQRTWELYKTTQFVIAQPLSSELNFAILTAQNPKGICQSEAQNRYLDYALQQDIQRLNVPYRSMWGCAPDYSHRERSWAIVADKQPLIALAKLYQQNAIYWVEEDRLYLLPCLLQGFQAEYLGHYSERQRVASEVIWE
jgi:hypothetical protein